MDNKRFVFSQSNMISATFIHDIRTAKESKFSNINSVWYGMSCSATFIRPMQCIPGKKIDSVSRQ
ncbi:hypothetical protein DERF_013384 [Dermatophagoides farinae]|uniref:Uncharacterized protein n=1 Tax=Dermatophagoides farinae TaxID=6954 RepID=A0A922HM47_DERFA|nr:hypothetical protein DERF_013384 [Dermatophagoides farinae]